MLTRAQSVIQRLRSDIPATSKYPDFPASFEAIRKRVQPYTMTSPERMFALYEATRYVVLNDIAGDLVECGVWRGGSSMVTALALLELEAQRDLWLFDTFQGMPEPTARDVDLTGHSATEQLAKDTRVGAVGSVRAYATLEEVEANLRLTGYRPECVHYVVGDVEHTIPASAPAQIALLRLDTDWYASTRHELEHLWPRLTPGGVLIIDDYGHWQGAREAVDEFFDRQPARPLLHRVDYTGRVAVKA